MINTIHDEYIRIGKVVGTHGLKGRLKILLITDNPERFYIDNEVYFKINNFYKKFRVSEYKDYKKQVALVSFFEIDDINIAEQYIKSEIFILQSDARSLENELDDDSFFYFDLIGCSIYIDDNEFGEVIEILEAGSGEILHVKTIKGAMVMIPFVEEMVTVTSIHEKRIDVTPVEGLFDI